MILSVTKIELISYTKLIAFFTFNKQIIEELKVSDCKKFKVTGNWNGKIWYTMTLWENEQQLNEFYRKGTHLEAMKQAKNFSSKMYSYRIERDDLIGWDEAKKRFVRTVK